MVSTAFRVTETPGSCRMSSDKSMSVGVLAVGAVVLGCGEYDGELCGMVSTALRVTVKVAGTGTIRCDEYDVIQKNLDEENFDQ